MGLENIIVQVLYFSYEYFLIKNMIVFKISKKEY